jgi:hypothetical protein
MKRIVVPAGKSAEGVRVLEVLKPGSPSTAEFERSVLPVEGVKTQDYARLAETRSRFHSQFGAAPALLTAEGISHPIAFYFIGDLGDRTRPSANHEDRSSDSAFFNGLRRTAPSLRDTLRVVAIVQDKISEGSVRGLSPMEIGLAYDSKDLYIIEGPNEMQFVQALDSARQDGGGDKMNPLLASLGRFFKRVGESGLSADGLCFPDRYVVKDGEVMIRRTIWAKDKRGRTPVELTGDLLNHRDVWRVVNTVFIKNERDREAFEFGLYGPRKYDWD